MLLAALISLLSVFAVFLFIILFAYTLLYGSLIFSYFFLWDATTRRSICPHGLLHALLYDE